MATRSSNAGPRVASGVNTTRDDHEAVRPDSEPQPGNAAVQFGPLKHLGHYSVVSGSDIIQYDLSCLHQFQEPSTPADLTHGLRGCLNRNRNNNTLGHPVALDSILGACSAFNNLEAVRNAHVVTWRGIVTKLMVSDEPLHLHVSFIDDVLYALEVDPSPGTVHIKQLKSGYHGYAFEALCTNPLASKADPYRVDLDVWKCVASRTLGDLNLVFGAEVDCVRGEYAGDSSNLVELKTLAEDKKRSRNSKKWYIQSYLMDIPEIYVGYRSANFTLTRTQSFATDHFVPDARWLLQAQRNAHNALKALRQLCASHRFRSDADRHDAIWRATVRHGAVQQFRLLDDTEVSQLRTKVSGPRIGLVPAECIAQIRALQ